ncbi:MAG: hypothetical protein ABIP95_09220 [Pelobium sp.]
MFSDYKEAVINTYERKMEKGDLPPNLLNPTTAKLKDEWLNVLNETYDQRHDDVLLRDFFGPKDDLLTYERAIKAKGADRCRPLYNFLNGEIEDPKERTIELLAWLIKFELRPYWLWDQKKGKINTASKEDDVEKGIVQAHQMLTFAKEEGKTNIGESEDADSKQETNTTPTEEVIVKENDLNEVIETVSKKRLHLGYLVAFIAFIFIGLSISFFTENGYLNRLFGNHCMYWATDHYEPIACDQATPEQVAIALNPIQENLKKITRIDTLTADCIGKIWYSKIDTEVEFFTGSGKHPVHIEKGLKLVTDHIYDQYIRKKDSADLN